MSIKNIFDTQILKEEFYFTIFKVSAEYLRIAEGNL